jgi:glycosyltransferase involved in cell wall biosynthesis
MMDASIIIPALNEEKYIERCLKSLREQDYSGKYEIIVGDGQSTDKTVKIAERYADKVVSEPTPTIAAGRQKATEFAKGDILVSTDADVITPKDWLREVMSNFQDKDVVGMHGNILPYDGNWLDKQWCLDFFPPYSRLMIKLKRPSPPGSNFAMRRKVFKKVGGFNTKLVTGEDVDLAKRIQRHGKFTFNPKAIVYVSSRRLRHWGYKRYILFHAINAFNLHFSPKRHGKMSYNPER